MQTIYIVYDDNSRTYNSILCKNVKHKEINHFGFLVA